MLNARSQIQSNAFECLYCRTLPAAEQREKMISPLCQHENMCDLPRFLKDQYLETSGGRLGPWPVPFLNPFCAFLLWGAGERGCAVPEVTCDAQELCTIALAVMPNQHLHVGAL